MTREYRLAAAIIALTWSTSTFAAQNAHFPSRKSNPSKVETQFVVMPESVVEEQWPHTLQLVNPPQFVAVVNPGECVRLGIYATGDDRDSYLKQTRLSFTVRFAGHAKLYPFAPLLQFKQIKPEGEPFVDEALHVGAAELPAALKTMATLGASAGEWCVPAGATDGNATIEAEVQTPNAGRHLEPALIQVKASKRAVKDRSRINKT